MIIVKHDTVFTVSSSSTQEIILFPGKSQSITRRPLSRERREEGESGRHKEIQRGREKQGKDILIQNASTVLMYINSLVILIFCLFVLQCAFNISWSYLRSHQTGCSYEAETSDSPSVFFSPEKWAGVLFYSPLGPPAKEQLEWVQSRTTRMMRGMEHLFCWINTERAGVVQLGGVKKAGRHDWIFW